MNQPSSEPLPPPLTALETEAKLRRTVESAHAAFQVRPSAATFQTLYRALDVWGRNDASYAVAWLAGRTQPTHELGGLRAMVATLDGLPDDLPVAILFDDDFGSSEAIESHGLQDRFGVRTVVLSISGGQ